MFSHAINFPVVRGFCPVWPLVIIMAASLLYVVAIELLSYSSTTGIVSCVYCNELEYYN